MEIRAAIFPIIRKVEIVFQRGVGYDPLALMRSLYGVVGLENYSRRICNPHSNDGEANSGRQWQLPNRVLQRP